VALALGGKAGNLSWAIWWLAGVERSNPIRLTGRVLRDFHISPRAARRLLLNFERAGLVEVDRQRGRSPLVTLLEVKPQEPTGD
jgi:DNA-binding transcriptional ArsR family regulator